MDYTSTDYQCPSCGNPFFSKDELVDLRCLNEKCNLSKYINCAKCYMDHASLTMHGKANSRKPKAQGGFWAHMHAMHGSDTMHDMNTSNTNEDDPNASITVAAVDLGADALAYERRDNNDDDDDDNDDDDDDEDYGDMIQRNMRIAAAANGTALNRVTVVAEQVNDGDDDCDEDRHTKNDVNNDTYSTSYKNQFLEKVKQFARAHNLREIESFFFLFFIEHQQKPLSESMYNLLINFLNTYLPSAYALPQSIRSVTIPSGALGTILMFGKPNETGTGAVSATTAVLDEDDVHVKTDTRKRRKVDADEVEVSSRTPFQFLGTADNNPFKPLPAPPLGMTLSWIMRSPSEIIQELLAFAISDPTFRWTHNDSDRPCFVNSKRAQDQLTAIREAMGTEAIKERHVFLEYYLDGVSASNNSSSGVVNALLSVANISSDSRRWVREISTFARELVSERLFLLEFLNRCDHSSLLSVMEKYDCSISISTGEGDLVDIAKFLGVKAPSGKSKTPCFRGLCQKKDLLSTGVEEPGRNVEKMLDDMIELDENPSKVHIRNILSKYGFSSTFFDSTGSLHHKYILVYHTNIHTHTHSYTPLSAGCSFIIYLLFIYYLFNYLLQLY
jgi:hypothetical protein